MNSESITTNDRIGKVHRYDLEAPYGELTDGYSTRPCESCDYTELIFITGGLKLCLAAPGGCDETVEKVAKLRPTALTRIEQIQI
jgi:hypothetical protein